LIIENVIFVQQTKPMRPPRQLKSAELATQIEKLLSKSPKTTFTSKQISRKINVANPPAAVLKEILSLVTTKKVIRLGVDHYRWANTAAIPTKKSALPVKESRTKGAEFSGKVDMTRSGDAYITGTEYGDDIYVPSKYLRGALDRDEVMVALDSLRGRRRPEGKVTAITKRALSRLIGFVRIHKHMAVLYPENHRFITEVAITPEDIGDAQDGDRVAIEITDWGNGKRHSLRGKVISILENLSEHEARMQGILLSHGFDPEFPAEVLAEIADVHGEITNDEVARRRDMREIFTITIDPLTAKDFDDAISYRILDDGDIEIGIHIADVTHYLHEGTALDKEALRRSTSVYLADRVCPMLPEKLSNDLCSLNPHEDKYTFSAIFTIDAAYDIIDEWYGKTIIHSNRRFTYEEAQERIESGEGDYAVEINTLNKIAHHLRDLRYDEGSISFESAEVNFILDENHQPIGVYAKERKEAHMLIEDFMLLANRKVAAYVFHKAKPEIPLVYRIHDLPNPEKLADFALFARELGFAFKMDKPEQISHSFNELAKAAEQNPALRALEPLAIRTMAKAAYSTQNIGHYGLGFEYYAHFTSPIRRYADVLVHRTLFKNLTDRIVREDQPQMEAKAKHISEMERKATEAERESTKYMQSLYISKYLGHTFDGTISGMIDRGIFVELTESKVEGFCAFDLMGDVFLLNTSRTKAKSRISGDTFTMGQSIKVKIAAVSIEEGKVDMEIVDDEE
jgi:ribonuclease R